MRILFRRSIALRLKAVASIVSTTTALAVSGGAMAQNSTGTYYLPDPDKTKLAAEVENFTDVARRLNDLNKATDSRACDKLDLVWDAITASAQDPNALYAPNAEFNDVLTFGNGSALRFWRIFSGWSAKDWGGASAAEAENLGSEIRPYRQGHLRDTVRLTHRFGVNVKLSYVPLEGAAALGLTGQYATRNDCVLGRLSSAVPTSVEERFTPAISTKFFVDGAHESQVLIAQHDIGGQSWRKDALGKPIIDNNFYSKYLSNRLSFEKGALSGVGAFSRFFYTAQYFSRNVLGLNFIFDPRELSANHLANLDVHGQTSVAPKGPRFIWTVAPTPELRGSFAEQAKNDLDFRRHFLGLNGQLTLGESPIFLVYGSDTWTYDPEKDATLIGKFVVNSDFVVSEAADIRLFFRHAIQYHQIPEAVGAENPYTQDYPMAQWGDALFTSDCALGVKEKDVWPWDLSPYYGKADQHPGVDYSQGSLDGSFLYNAISNPAEVRLSKNYEWCFGKVMAKRLGLEEALKRL